MEDDVKRYEAACHAMQTGVALMMNYAPESTEPKHLRTGINSAMVETSALAYLLIKKGVFTEDEYDKAIADFMEQEVAFYSDQLKARLGKDVTLV